MFPPAIQMLTESGRFRTNVNICTSASSLHRERWNPDLTVMTLLIGFLSLFLDDKDSGIGHVFLVFRKDERRCKLAADSWEANSRSPEFLKLFPEFQGGPVAKGHEIVPGEAERCELGLSSRGRLGNSLRDGQQEVDSGTVGQSLDDCTSTVCRFCLRADPHEPLMDPPACMCRGTIGGAHPSCLQEWIRKTGHLTCNTCKARYTGSRLLLERPRRLLQVIANLDVARGGVIQALGLACIETWVILHRRVDLVPAGWMLSLLLYMMVVCVGRCIGQR